MARVPGTETPINRAGWRTGTAVRCRRARANAARGLADRRGFVTEVRPHHARVLFATGGRSVWVESDLLVAEDDMRDPDLEVLRQVFVALRGRRLEWEEGAWVIFGESFAAQAVDSVRALLGDRLVSYEIAPHGVHELATRLHVAPGS